MLSDANAGAANGARFGADLKGVSSGLRLSLDRLGVGAADLDPAQLFLLGHDALQIDVKQTILKARTADLDILRQLETPLEGASGDAAMEVGLLARFVLVFALDAQDALADLDIQILLREAGDGECDSVMGLIDALDIVWWVALSRIELWS